MITFSADIRSAKAKTDDAITTSSVGIPVTLQLAPDFTGLAKTLVFKAGTVSVDMVLVGDATESLVPPNVLVKAGERLYVGIYAADGEGNIVIPTIWAFAGLIETGTLPSGVDPSDPVPNWVAQVQGIASDALQNSEYAVTTADNAYDAAVTAQTSASASASAAAQSASDASQSARDAAQSETNAAGSASDAARDADRAEQAAANAGFMDVEIVDGRLIYTRTDAVDVDFSIIDGHLWMEAI